MPKLNEMILVWVVLCTGVLHHSACRYPSSGAVCPAAWCPAVATAGSPGAGARLRRKACCLAGMVQAEAWAVRRAQKLHPALGPAVRSWSLRMSATCSN
jgi:hypothetical protein